jgi:hypothetical protein
MRPAAVPITNEGAGALMSVGMYRSSVSQNFCGPLYADTKGRRGHF